MSKIESLKARLNDLKGEAGKQISRLVDFIIENPAEAAAVGAVFVSGLKTLRGFSKDIFEQRNRKKWYDPHSGFHWDLLRKPTNEDRKFLAAKLEEGISAGDALRERGLI